MHMPIIIRDLLFAWAGLTLAPENRELLAGSDRTVYFSLFLGRMK